MIQIGKHRLASNVLLAPMSGVTDLPFRRLVSRFGAGLVISEMIASRAAILYTKQSMQKCRFDKKDGQINVVQLAGCDPDIIAEAAKINEDMGADIIDLNFGCPVKKVVGGNAGSALMKDEELAAKILEATVKAVSVPVTLKMRMGWDHSSLNAPKLAMIAESLGIKMITVHGRTRCQLYKGTANWEFVNNVKKTVNIPVIVNGDIKSFQDSEEALKLSGADGVMIGRGCYGKPWFINQTAEYLKTGREISDPTIEEKYEIITEHFEGMIEHYGYETGIRMSRKHLGWYSSGMSNSNEFRMKINKTTDYNEMKDEIKSFFN